MAVPSGEFSFVRSRRLAPKAHSHTSLGQRPRKFRPDRASAESAAQMNESRLQRWRLVERKPWGVAPGWYEEAPLALQSIRGGSDHHTRGRVFSPIKPTLSHPDPGKPPRRRTVGKRSMWGKICSTARSCGITGRMKDEFRVQLNGSTAALAFVHLPTGMTGRFGHANGVAAAARSPKRPAPASGVSRPPASATAPKVPRARARRRVCRVEERR